LRFQAAQKRGCTGKRIYKHRRDDDPAVNRGGFVQKIDEAGVINFFSPDKLNIFLKHQPRIETENIGKFDLQLSGHTHRGQISPLIFL
jgi:predicted MPP superfamily phosphohydrolase